jgi:hypothetical protein
MIKRIIGLCVAASLAASTAARAAAPPPDPRPVFTQLADEVTTKLLESPEYQARTTSGRKPRIVVGDIRNNTDDEGVRVEDIFNEIRNVLVASGTARLFSPGELNADLIISPELTSSSQAGPRGRRQRCVVLQLTTTTVSGEYFTAHSATRCN